MLSKLSVKKPYTVIVVIVLGAVSLTKMTTDLLPDMSLPYALVITTDMGASPEKVESDVTAPVEASMATTSSIKNVSSASYDNYSMVILEYEQNANMDSVIIEIQQKPVRGQFSGWCREADDHADRPGYDACNGGICRCGRHDAVRDFGLCGK